MKSKNHNENIFYQTIYQLAESKSLSPPDCTIFVQKIVKLPRENFIKPDYSPHKECKATEVVMKFNAEKNISVE